MRVRPSNINENYFLSRFNPRTHESATGKELYIGIDLLVSIHALMRVRLLGVYDTDYQQCNGRFAPTSHGRYKDSRS